MASNKLQNLDQQITVKIPSPETSEETSEGSSILEDDEEEEGDEISDESSSSSRGSDETSSSVLTEILSPWRAAAHLHKQTCRAKFLREFGKDLHLHSDDSDTMIKLKEKITPSCAQVAAKERIRMKTKKVSKSIPTPFDEWLQKKHKELKHQKMHSTKEQEMTELREAAEEAKKSNKRDSKIEKWRKHRQHLEKEKTVIEKIKARDKSEKQYSTDIKSNTIPVSEWENIKKAAEDMKNFEPLKLGILEGQGNEDPGKYLTKYVVQPDPAFRARYKHILEAEQARPTEIVLDGDHNEDEEDPAELPRQFKQLLREETENYEEYLTTGDSLNEANSDCVLSSIGSEHLSKHKGSKKSKSKRKPAERRKSSFNSGVSTAYSGSCLKEYNF